MGWFKKEEKALTSSELLKELSKEAEDAYQRMLDRDEIQLQANNLEDKAKRLKALGFQMSKDVKDSEHINQANNAAHWTNKYNAKVLESMSKVRKQYPGRSIISQDSLQLFCKKHKLSYAGVHLYKGEVPVECIDEMESIKIPNEDKVYKVIGRYREDDRKSYNYVWDELNTYAKKDMHDKKHGDELIGYYPTVEMLGPGNSLEIVEQPMVIICPGKFIENFPYHERGSFYFMNSEDPTVTDPIVLKPVMKDDEIYFIAITNWD